MDVSRGQKEAERRPEKGGGKLRGDVKRKGRKAKV